MSTPKGDPMPQRADIEARDELVTALFPALRRFASTSQRMVGHLEDSEEVLDLLSRLQSPALRQLVTAGGTLADLKCALLDLPATGAPIGDHVATQLAAVPSPPAAFLVPGVGLFTFGPDKDVAVAAATTWIGALRLLDSAEDIGTATALALGATEGSASPKPLSGRVALVTGGGSGIGRAVAEALSAQGACVVVADRDLPAAEKTVAEFVSPAWGLSIEVDVCDETAIHTAVAATVRAFGGLDLLVNNAGLSISKPLRETSSDDWDLQHDVMARGSFLMAQAAAKVMVEQQLDSDIVYIVSKNAAFAGPNNVAYGATKANQAHQVRLLAAELGLFGIRVNGVSPDGVVRGSGIFANGWGEERAKVYGVTVDELGAFYAQRTLLKREVLPSHIADAVLALTSGLLSRTTGAIIPVDGGVTGAFQR